MMESIDSVGLARVVAGAVVLAGLAASIASCSGNGSNVPSTAQSPTTTTGQGGRSASASHPGRNAQQGEDNSPHVHRWW